MTEHSSTAMLNCGESKKYCHTVIFAGILEMNATLRSQAKYRGVAVKFLLEVEVAFVWRRSPLHLLAPPPIALLGRREVVAGWSRAYQLLRKNVYIASPLTTSNRPLFKVSKMSRAAAGLLSRWSWQRQRLCSGGVESAVSEGRLVAGGVSERRKSAQAGARSRRTYRAVP